MFTKVKIFQQIIQDCEWNVREETLFWTNK